VPQCVYIVECADGSLYTGYTTDVARRVREHNAGTGAKYTAGRRPVRLRYVEYHPTQSAAMRREHEIKSLTRAEKEQFVPDESDRIGVDIRDQ
jgi:putative endonuclease